MENKNVNHIHNNKFLEEPLSQDELWENLFPNDSREFVPWDEFLLKVQYEQDYESLVYEEEGKRYFNLTKKELELLHPYIKQRTNLSRSGFLRLFSFFSPIKRTCSGPPGGYWIFDDVIQVLSLESFHGFEDSSSLSRKLATQEEGTFITRFSPTRTGGYAIQIKSNTVVALKIETQGVHHLNMPCSSIPSYPSLKDLLEEHKTTPLPKVPLVLKQPLPIEESKKRKRTNDNESSNNLEEKVKYLQEKLNQTEEQLVGVTEELILYKFQHGSFLDGESNKKTRTD